MKKTYYKPEFQTIHFQLESVLKVSGGGGIELPDDDWLRTTPKVQLFQK